MINMNSTKEKSHTTGQADEARQGSLPPEFIINE
jgi:hypothetical protein